jgi:hypothetical protein
MYNDFCPECGHLLPTAQKICSFCGRSLMDRLFMRERLKMSDNIESLNEFMSDDDRNDYCAQIL